MYLIEKVKIYQEAITSPDTLSYTCVSPQTDVGDIEQKQM